MAAVRRPGDFYRRRYTGLYCPGCEQFYPPADLVDGRCPEHRTPPQTVAEENWFFRLSPLRRGLRKTPSESGRVRVEPATRRNEVLAFLRGGAADISVSRPAARAHGWGIPVPDDPEQVIYVWWDALANYITALGRSGGHYQRWWTGLRPSGCTSSARASCGSTPCTGSRCCSRPACRCRQRSSCTST